MALLKIARKGEKKALGSADSEPLPVLAHDQLGISDLAALRIKELMAEKPATLYFRVAIRGGGCSGLSIHYEWAETQGPNDMLFTKDGAQVVIDKKSLGVLGGATLHCRSYLGSTEFLLVNNPASKQCSCGQSFSL